jgi:ferric-dicitrate binding protein FerR (iron transport regulator)
MPTIDRTTHPGSLRVSDAEREQVAARVRDAATVGMLTLAEADERQAAAYAAQIRADLAELTDDLPAAPAEPDLSVPLELRVRRRLAVHVAVVAVLAAVLIVRWTLGPAEWFWPAGPMFWLALSVVLHYRWVRYRRAL